MKLVYTLSIIILVAASLVAVAETFALLAPPLWLAQINGLLIVASMFTALAVKVKLHTHRAQPLHIRNDR